jgi:hypothetical protein
MDELIDSRIEESKSQPPPKVVVVDFTRFFVF